MTPYLVGITGGSASGKTYVLDRICEAFDSQTLTLISQDNYYKDLEDQERDEDGNINFDHPNAVHLDLLTQHVRQIMKGETIQIRKYTFNNPNIPDEMLTYAPAPLIIIEGLFVFYKTALSKLFDLRIFIEVDEHIKLTRRIKRDFAERGFTLDEILAQYSRDVVPMYRKYIEPYKFEADIILPNNYKPDKGIQIVIDHLKSRLTQQSN
jgi:uridine kinase